MLNIWEAKDASQATGNDCHRETWLNMENGQDVKVYNIHVYDLCVTGTAYIHGIKHATGNFIILMDADLSHHVSVSLYCMQHNMYYCHYHHHHH